MPSVILFKIAEYSTGFKEECICKNGDIYLLNYNVKQEYQCNNVNCNNKIETVSKCSKIGCDLTWTMNVKQNNQYCTNCNAPFCQEHILNIKCERCQKYFCSQCVLFKIPNFCKINDNWYCSFCVNFFLNGMN